MKNRNINSEAGLTREQIMVYAFMGVMLAGGLLTLSYVFQTIATVY